MEKTEKLKICKDHAYELRLQMQDFENCVGAFPEDSELEALSSLTVKLRQARAEFGKSMKLPAIPVKPANAE